MGLVEKFDVCKVYGDGNYGVGAVLLDQKGRKIGAIFAEDSDDLAESLVRRVGVLDNDQIKCGRGVHPAVADDVRREVDKIAHSLTYGLV